MTLNVTSVTVELPSSTSKLNSTFGMIGKATADKMTAKVVGKLKLSLQGEELI